MAIVTYTMESALHTIETAPEGFDGVEWPLALKAIVKESREKRETGY